MIKKLLYVVIILQITLLLFVIQLFRNDSQGISQFTFIDPETGIEETISGCEELRGLEIIIRDCINW